MDRNNNGALTPEEREQLEALVELSEAIAIVRAQALHLLKRSPQGVSGAKSFFKSRPEPPADASIVACTKHSRAALFMLSTSRRVFAAEPQPWKTSPGLARDATFINRTESTRTIPEWYGGFSFPPPPRPMVRTFSMAEIPRGWEDTNRKSHRCDARPQSPSTLAHSPSRGGLRNVSSPG